MYMHVHIRIYIYRTCARARTHAKHQRPLQYKTHPFSANHKNDTGPSHLFLRRRVCMRRYNTLDFPPHFWKNVHTYVCCFTCSASYVRCLQRFTAVQAMQAYTSLHIQRHATQETDLFRVSPPPRSRSVIQSSAKTSFTSPISAIVVCCISADTLDGRRGIFPREHLTGQGGAPMRARLAPRLEQKTLCRTYGNAAHEGHRLAAIIRAMHRNFRMISSFKKMARETKLEKTFPPKIPFYEFAMDEAETKVENKSTHTHAHTHRYRHTNTQKNTHTNMHEHARKK